MKAQSSRQVLLFSLLLVVRRDGLMYQQPRQPARFCNSHSLVGNRTPESRNLHDSGSWFLHFDGGIAQKVRHYYIEAQDVIWDFAPTNQNLVHGGQIPEPWTNSHVFPKVRYIQYTDASFSTPKPQPSWLGVLGPIIRAEVGDEVVVLFRNRAFRAGGNYGMHPHGFRFTKDNQGAHYIPAGAGAEVPPGGQFEYHWLADEDSGPGLGDPSSLVWWYHSHVNEPQETNLGLVGPIIITRRGMARPDGSPRDVNREFVTAVFIFDELEGEEAGLMHSINGYIFGNLRGLEMNNGDKVRWYLLGMGNEVDLHTPIGTEKP
jgi:Multicopper oxidase